MRRASAIVAFAVLTTTLGWAQLSDRPMVGRTAAVRVDSTFDGYGSLVLTDGKWVALGHEISQDISTPDYLGNAGNTWVSASQPTAEHWVCLEWPAPVAVSEVTVVWSRPEWYPAGFRLESRVGDEWRPVSDFGGEWYAPTAQQTTFGFERLATQALRVLQHAGGGGPRGLMAVQEVIVNDSPSQSPGLHGARVLRPSEVRRLGGRQLVRDIARLGDSQPGASEPLAWDRDGKATKCTGLTDGDTRSPAVAPARTRALGVRWPIQHVVDRVTVYSSGPPGPLAVEAFDGLRWVGIVDALEVASEPNARAMAFRPVATTGLRVVGPGVGRSVTELEVDRYLPEGPYTWPAYLVDGNGLEGEILGSGREPSYERLCMAALSMRPARALLGLKDAREEVGATWDGEFISAIPLRFTFGLDDQALSEAPDTVTRSLIDGWRPGVVICGSVGSLEIRETAFVAPIGAGGRSGLFVRLHVRNPGEATVPSAVNAYLSLPDGVEPRVRDGCVAAGDELALVTAQRSARLGPAGELVVDLTLAPGVSAEVDLVQPLGAAVPVAEAGLYRSVPFGRALAGFREYWDRMLAPAATFHTPEAHVNALYRAVLAQLLINADGNVMPYGAQPSVYEGSLFGVEEGFAMIALAQSGLLDDTQRYMDGTYLTPGFLRKVDTYRSVEDRHQQYRNGLQPSYAVQTFRLSGDEQWIRRHLPLLRDCAEWTIAARRQTMVETGGDRPLHWGLLPEWAYGGDIGNVLCYALYANFACLRGLWDTAWLMRELGDEPTAERYFAEARDYARCIERAVDGSIRREQRPPFLPMQLYSSEPVGNDYDQLFDGLALDLRPFHPNDRRVNVITDWLEQTNQTFCRLPRFRPGSAKGGLDAIYSIGHVLTKLQQDRIDEFLLGFYGSLAFNMERDTFASRETNVIYASDLHARNDYGAPDLSDPVPCSAAVALQYLRAMLVTERWEAPSDAPRDLLLLHGAPRAWFADGETIEMRGAPTDFGEVDLRVTSRVARGTIEADVEPPGRRSWRALSLRLRHPEGLPIRAVTVNGQPWSAFDARRDVVTLRPGPRRFHVEARY